MMRRSRSLLSAAPLALLSALFLGVSATSAAAAKPFAVVGYLPEWRYEGANWDTLTTHLTHLILFSAEPGPDGSLWGLDRLPRHELLEESRAAAKKNGAKLLLCFGGNGRSAGFSEMSRNKAKRKRFIKEAIALMDKMGADGVDYNWEYPGYSFGSGYHAEAQTKKDYEGLAALIKETRAALGPDRPITMAYYPDGKQEAYIKALEIPKHADLFHMMTYDQQDAQNGHSSVPFAKRAMQAGIDAGIPAEKLTLGLPFYGRNSRTGDWTTYEDLVQRHHPLKGSVDSVSLPDGSSVAFNGKATIRTKTAAAVKAGLGGVMIWEAGQDCRQVAVTHGDTTHTVTCPEGRESSLLVAISRELAAAGRARATAEHASATLPSKAAGGAPPSGSSERAAEL